ncbi:hypothetical protein [Nocardioides zeae]|uniref:Prenyltransferase n=1 Tax=Nocardioides zeae TaxID=1457234 RepID=A0A6P0HGT4_9ACTN|nr:hypothetical protein [Nocardioides zeae]NEN77470.1 hypothetical protein [Nocardioides zeae]
MSIDLPAAVAFVEANARLLDRRRAELLLGTGTRHRVVAALRPYANADGGFGSALEPDVRGPHSEPTAALAALEVLAEVGTLDDPATADLVRGVAAWVAGVAEAGGGVPFVVAATAEHPRGPWMQPTPGGSHLTFGLAGALHGRDLPWVGVGTAWCWARLEGAEPLDAYSVKFALDLLDAVSDDHPDAARADAAVERLRDLVGAEGTIPVPGGTDGERLHLLDVAPRPRGRSRGLFTADQVAADLDRLEAGQQDDGGWTFDWLAWSPGQSAEWRGLVTLRALRVLAAHGRLG